MSGPDLGAPSTRRRRIMDKEGGERALAIFSSADLRLDRVGA
jgi:hypothetical protein